MDSSRSKAHPASAKHSAGGDPTGVTPLGLARAGDPVGMNPPAVDSLLWLPPSFFARAEASPTPAETGMFWGLTPGYGELLGGKSDWGAVVDRLRGYSLAQVLDILGRVSAVIQSVGPWRRAEGQRQLFRSLFHAKKAQVWASLAKQERERATDPLTSLVVFHDLQLISLAKAAILEVPPVLPRER